MLGGILADDMGLGKTLTMIATIMTTTLHAERFVEGKLRSHENTKAPMIPVKSTLIIVPSACRFPMIAVYSNPCPWH
jgi:SWI/SNF-related matrix-associated actin-dependent regulator of chromatin subfamily A3